MSQENLCRLALYRAEMIGSGIAKNLIAYCGSAEEVLKTSKHKLIKIPGIGEATAEAVSKVSKLDQAEKELTFIEEKGIRMLFHTDEDYPSRLRQYHDCPMMLFYKGSSNLNSERVVAVVGTRSVTDYGRSVTEKLLAHLAEFKVLIVSGLAFGVDTIAHRAALTQGLETVGVLGHGLDRLYPSENESLARKMMASGGLLTEFMTGTRPDRQNFPMRNRIVAGMSDAVVVVETKREGGSMITAELANDYNKDVFAFPGRVDDEYSAGCNKLIRDHKAHLIESGQDLTDLMRWNRLGDEPNLKIQPALFHDLPESEQRVFDYIRNNQKVHIDLLHKSHSLTPGEMAGILLSLQIKGLVLVHPGKIYSTV
jgi:DNA processing protein